MTKKIIEPWQQAVMDMEKSAYGGVRLIADGYKLSIQVGRSKNRIVFVWYVDGSWLGEYFDNTNVVGAKFGLPYKFRFPAKLYDQQKRYHGKQKADADKAEYEAKIHGYKNYYPSAKAIIAQLKKTCASVELVVD